jgi:tetratricopeptide (TPR) repeat protein
MKTELKTNLVAIAKPVLILSGVMGCDYVVTEVTSTPREGFWIFLGIVVFFWLLINLWEALKENYVDYSLSLSPRRDSGLGVEPQDDVVSFSREDSLLLEWARECLKNGRSLEAGIKIERISPDMRTHPDVLKLRYEIFKHEHRWHAAFDTAVAYSKKRPNDVEGWLGQAICLHEMKLSQRALNTLLHIVDRFPESEMIPYNIALFTCELGRLEQAKRWMFKALELCPNRQRLILKAMNEPDLEPLLHFLGRKAMIEKLVSGGLTGAERTAMDFAAAHGIPHGGWCPKARAGEDGFIIKHYNLKETPSSGYLQRTEWNVRGSDGTVIFSLGEDLTGACSKTTEMAGRYGKPVIHLRRDQAYGTQAARLLEFLEKHHVQVLNISGTSASKEPAVGEFVQEVMERAFQMRLKSILENAGVEPEKAA